MLPQSENTARENTERNIKGPGDLCCRRCITVYVVCMYTSGFGHLLSVEHEMAIAAHAFGPLIRSVFPDGGVVVQAEAQMVVDQILA